jgi:hypothetical protein
MIRIPKEVVTTNLDPSWGGVLVYAREKRLQFGTDIVFTYGPLGYLAIQWFTGHAPGLRMLFDLPLDFGIAAGVCLIAWRTGVYWRTFLLGVFVLLPATIRPGMIDVPLSIGLFSWALLCFVESGPRVRLFAGILAAFAIVGSMMKFTFLVMALITISATAANFALRGKKWLGCGLVAAYLTASFCAWVLLGQNPLHLGAYLQSSIALSAGYQSAMGHPFVPSVWVAGLITAILALAIAVIRSLAADEALAGGLRLRRSVFLAWVFCILFLDWKHGFLRAKSDLWTGFVAFVAPALEALPVPDARRAASWLARACAISCCLVALMMEKNKDPAHFRNFAVVEAARFGDNVRALLNPPGYAREMNKKLDTTRARAQLPKLRESIGRATVDVFGQSQAYALFNDLNYRPRPVFQSYFAFNSALMEANERAFASNAAPEFVLFNFEAIDGRFPPLEDARVLRTLLSDYTLVGAEAPFLLLKHQTSSVPRMTLLREGVVRPDEPISVGEYGDVDLWLEISLAPSMEGRLRQAIYKPTEVYLAVWGQSTAQAAMFRAPVPMLAAGFLASPVLLRNQDIVELYTGSTIHHPGGYAIHLQPGSANLWQDLIQYRLYRLDVKLGRNSLPLPLPMKSPRP